MLEKKDIITAEHLREDIFSHKKFSGYHLVSLVCAVVSIVCVIAAVVSPWFLLGTVAALIVLCVWESFGRIFFLKYKEKKFSIGNYRISTEVLVYIKEDRYERHTRYQTIEVVDYILHFENEETWRIPEISYAWSERHRMGERQLLEDSHREELFILVHEKKNDDLVMVYPAKHFEYEGK